MTENSVTRRQLMALAFVSLLSPGLRAISESEMAVVKKGVCLSPIFAALPVLALFLLTDRLSRWGELDGLFRRAYGKTAGGVVTVIFALWLTFYTGLALRVAGDRLVSCVYTDAHWAIFAAVIAVSAALASSGSVKTLVRTAGLFLPIVAAALIAVFLMLLTDIKSENLLPLTVRDVPPALTGTVHIISAGSMFAYYGFLPAAPSQMRGEGIGYVAGVMAVMLAVTVTVVGILGARLAAAMESPFFVIIRNVTLFNILERIEAVVVALWVVSDLAFVSSMLCAASTAMERATKMARGIWAPILAAAAMASGALASSSSFGIERVIQIGAPVGNIILLFIVLPLTAAVLAVKGRRVK